MARRPPSELAAGVLRGSVPSIARLISKAEAPDAECREALAEIYRMTSGAHIVGVTGVPGSGKSTLINCLVRAVQAQGRKVAIFAIDPSSPYSGGSILGDRIRMNEIAGLPGVFIRSMATHGALGGLSAAILEAVDIADAAGYELIIIETVGVGQDEVDIVTAAHTVVVVSAPGLGDEVQAMKAGILEIADIHVVSKADKPEANETARAIREMVMLMPSARSAGSWIPPVLSVSAVKVQGVDEILAAIGGHRAHLRENGTMAGRVRAIAETRVLKSVDSLLLKARHGGNHASAMSDLFDRVAQRQLTPHDAALDLLRLLNGGDDDEHL